jgi:hypothetical protein
MTSDRKASLSQPSDYLVRNFVGRDTEAKRPARNPMIRVRFGRGAIGLTIFYFGERQDPAESVVTWMAGFESGSVITPMIS